MKNNNVSQDESIYISATNKVVNEINEKYFQDNKNDEHVSPSSFIIRVNGHLTSICEIPENDFNTVKNHIEIRDLTLKVGLKVMVTENLAVSNKICNGTNGTITEIKYCGFEKNQRRQYNNEYMCKTDDLRNKKYELMDKTHENIKIMIETTDGRIIEISYIESGDSEYNKDVDIYESSIVINKNTYSLYCKYIPLKQCNAMTIHKCQGMTLQKCILDCHGIFEKSMFYTGLSRIVDPKNMKVINFLPTHIKTSKEAMLFELKNEYSSYVEKMLISSDDENKRYTFKIKSDNNILLKNTIFYDFETASKGFAHYPYYNHMIRYQNDMKCEEKTLCHYKNSTDVKLDTFDYIMSTVTKQCDEYLEAKQNHDNITMYFYQKPLYLCGYNSSSFDLYFFVSQLLKSSYCDRFAVKTIFKSGALIFFMLVDKNSGKIALKSHDLCQITLASLAKTAESYLGKKLKGFYPHKYMINNLFNDKNIFDKTLTITKDNYKDYFYKRDHDEIINLLNKSKSLEFKLYENLVKYGNNDTEITKDIYVKINEICHQTLKCDVLSHLTLGSMSNYGFLLNLPTECKFRINRNTPNVITTKLYKCDVKENKLIRGSIYGGKSLPRCHHYVSKNVLNKEIKDIKYNDVKDYYTLFDVSGMYVNIQSEKDFPYDEARYATYEELKKMNKYLYQKQYKQFFDSLPFFSYVIVI